MKSVGTSSLLTEFLKSSPPLLVTFDFLAPSGWQGACKSGTFWGRGGSLGVPQYHFNKCRHAVISSKKTGITFKVRMSLEEYTYRPARPCCMMRHKKKIQAMLKQQKHRRMRRGGLFAFLRLVPSPSNEKCWYIKFTRWVSQKQSTFFSYFRLPSPFRMTRRLQVWHLLRWGWEPGGGSPFFSSIPFQQI